MFWSNTCDNFDGVDANTSNHIKKVQSWISEPLVSTFSFFFCWKRLCCITFQDHKSQLKNLDAFFWKWPLNKPVLKKRSLHWNSRVHKGIRAFKEFLPSQKILCRNSIWKRSFRAALFTLSYNLPSKYIGKYFLYAGFKFLLQRKLLYQVLAYCDFLFWRWKSH